MAYTQIDYNMILNFIESRYVGVLSAFLFCISLWAIIRILSKRKKLFYNTGFKLIFSAWDRLKFKIRLADYDDKLGVRYIYLFEIKIFCFDFFRLKYIDQTGKIYKRKLRFGGK